MLTIKNISKSFGKTKVLDDINLQINKGEIISLLGQSGSGKSTILNIIAGFEQADSGTCLYNNKIVFDNTTFMQPQNRNIGFVFQGYALFPHLTTGKNISFGITDKPKKFQQESITKFLEMMHMQDMQMKYPHQLSGGQQQRVAIARVLARESKLILFDEPFSSIDSTLKSKLIVEIKNIIKSQNITAIFVTHCPKEAMLLSDKIAYIEDGQIVQFDTPANIHKNPVSEAVADLFGKHSFIFQSIDDLLSAVSG